MARTDQPLWTHVLRALENDVISSISQTNPPVNGPVNLMKLNDNVDRVAAPPIAEAVSWLDAPMHDPRLPVIDLAQAVPSYPPSEHLTAHVAEFVRRPESAFYTPILGLPALRQALAADIAERYDTDIDGTCVAITAGANHAYCLATSAVAGPGDEIVLGTPYYFNHHMWLTMQGIRPVPLVCRPSPDGLLPDVGEAADLITDRTRAIALVTPNNPTGTVFAPDLLRAFGDLAASRGIALILDETYRDFLTDDATPHDLFGHSSWGDHLIHIYSFSKSFSLTGYRVGALAGGPALIAAVEKDRRHHDHLPAPCGSGRGPVRAATFARLGTAKARRDDRAGNGA